MNRCSSHWFRFSACAPLLLCAALTQERAAAQTTGRPIPPNAQRGTLEVTDPPYVLLDGKKERLSPGARIRGTHNMLVMSGAVIGQPLLVRYLREPQGQLHDIWILTAAEAAQPIARVP